MTKNDKAILSVLLRRYAPRLMQPGMTDEDAARMFMAWCRYQQELDDIDRRHGGGSENAARFGGDPFAILKQ